MKAKRLLFLVMAICLASGVKAQFYDSADDIYYYVEQYHEYDEYKSTSFNAGYYTGRTLRDKIDEDKAGVMIFNFDGTKAVKWSGKLPTVKKNIAQNASFYEDKVETTEYQLKYVSSSLSETIYKDNEDKCRTYIFSADRSTLKFVYRFSGESHDHIYVYKRVNKSDFKVGRSRTPSGTIYE